MDTNAQIILDLKNKIDPRQTLDILSNWKGVPVIIHGQILEISDRSVTFQVAPPDSISFTKVENVLILNDVFIMGIRGEIFAFDPKNGTLELGSFTYKDRGFGDREFVRVEPDEPISTILSFNNTSTTGTVIDISLNGFGILAQVPEGVTYTKDQAINLKLSLLDQEVDISGTILAVFPRHEIVRLAISFSQEAPGSAIVTRYISQRRAEIRQEIQAAYQQAIGNSN